MPKRRVRTKFRFDREKRNLLFVMPITEKPVTRVKDKRLNTFATTKGGISSIGLRNGCNIRGNVLRYLCINQRGEIV